MSKARDPKYKQGDKFRDDELNPNRPHDYRKENGESPIGNITKIWNSKTPEEKKEIIKKREEKKQETLNMKRRTKEILQTLIKLNPIEQVNFLDGLKTSGELSVQDAIIYAQVSKAVMAQDTSAAVFIRDTSGQKPKDEVEHNITIDNLLKDNGVFDEEDED